MKDIDRGNLPVLGAPFIRMAELPNGAQLFALGAGVFQVALADVFTLFFGLAVMTGAFDWYYGRLAARRNGTFDALKSTYGWHSKMAGFSILLVIRLSELGLDSANILDTKGLFATAMAAAIVFSEIESLDQHRQRLGAGPIPLLSRLLSFLRGSLDRLIPVVGPEVREEKIAPAPVAAVEEKP